MSKSISMRNCSTVSNARQQYWSPPAQQKLMSVRKYAPKTIFHPSKASSTANVPPTASCLVPAKTAAVSNGHILKEPVVKSAVPIYKDDNAKDLHKLAADVKHTQLFSTLVVLSAATACVNALAEAGPLGLGGMLVAGTAVASMMAPAMTKAIASYAMSKVTAAFKTRASQAFMPRHVPLPFVMYGTNFGPESSPVSHPLTFPNGNSDKIFTAGKDSSSIFQAEPEGGEGPMWLPTGKGVTGTVPQLPKGWGARKTVVKVTQLPTGWGVRVVKSSSSSTAVTQASESSHSAPAAAVSVVADVVPVKAAPLQVQPAAAASCASSAPGGEAHAAEQVGVPVSSTMRPVLAALCLRLAPDEHRKQPGGLIFTSGDLTIAPGGYWCNPGNAARLVKTQGQVQDRFLPASAADDSGLPRVEVSSMGEIFKQQWKALRVYATTPDNWPTEGRVVTYDDLKIVAAYGIQG